MALERILGVKKNFIHPGMAEFEEEEPFHIDNFGNPMHLALPPMANLFSSKVNFECDEHGRSTKMYFDHGTTTLGFVYTNGVILAVDSRATGGKYIGSQSMKKIIEINKYLVGTMAGGAADCVYWDRVLSKQCQLFELRNKSPISTAAASKLMANMAFSYKGTGLSMGMMIAGWDKNGYSLYYVDSEGQRTKSNVFSVGSGSLFAFGVLDSGLSFEMEDQYAYELARRSIYYATYRDSFSGGIVRVCSEVGAGNMRNKLGITRPAVVLLQHNYIYSDKAFLTVGLSLEREEIDGYDLSKAIKLPRNGNLSGNLNMIKIPYS